jgi:hypothetical protein
VSFLQELNQKAQGEVTIREALRELDLWGAGAIFALTEYEDSHKHVIMLIKDWKELVNQVCDTLVSHANSGCAMWTLRRLETTSACCNL